jgi:acetyltransferase-like isoleucine patch superfamily enzyme
MPLYESRTLPWDWYPGRLPDNVEVDDTAYIETTHSFLRFRSEEQTGARFGRGASMYKTSMLDVGPRGRVALGDYSLLQGVRIICDSDISIGDHCLLSWYVLLMDSYRLPSAAPDRRRALQRLPTLNVRRIDDGAGRPIRIGNNVWIGFQVCILPGVTIGDGAIVGARSVVAEDVAPGSIVAGNPARFVRSIDADGEPANA